MKTLPLFLSILILNFSHARSQTVDTLVNVGNHQLHFKILQGNGFPILFESGNGDDSTVWEPLLQDIHKETGATLITYDRAGLGKSGIDTTKVSFKQEVKNLKKALQKLGYTNKYFLVAHSFGSFYASEFSQRNKGKITGAVFIDVATPCALSVEYATKVKQSISEKNWALIQQHKTGLYYVLKKFPQIAEYMSKRFLSHSIPLTVIAADIRTPTKEIGETEQDMIHMTNCLKELGSLPNHKYVLATNTAHKVWKKDPKIVTKEIIELYKKTLVTNN